MPETATRPKTCRKANRPVVAIAAKRNCGYCAWSIDKGDQIQTTFAMRQGEGTFVPGPYGLAIGFAVGVMATSDRYGKRDTALQGEEGAMVMVDHLHPFSTFGTIGGWGLQATFSVSDRLASCSGHQDLLRYTRRVNLKNYTRSLSG